ncbi:DUF7281 domain-containing protein [Dyadobacter frigoris]|uniref:DUF7281 domain-containing protein n=1 Tax=Dyadobacter frigoris TaxID=2576211 RepID=A0A4U6CUC3_9BACT|nr:DUF2220 family protein [Dyadobacter frigoris]TKT86638.1 hypothetical protein FDK13_31830 [Dyadobacter frigoris]GLU56812.1 hypothetical protein Dfri01_62730 [Dyadobacter frigoris]
MILSLSLAEKLIILANGGQLSASSVKHAFVSDLITEGIITDKRSGRTKSTLQVINTDALNKYLLNKFSITDLQQYVELLRNAEITRAELVQVASNSKTINRRTFKGFLVNSYEPIEALLNGVPFTVNPISGTFQFIYDFEKFIPAPDVIIIGVENSENFSNIQKQRYLFPNIKALFVSRYPQNQSKDLIKWLQTIPNPYWHFGDYDFAGINIYAREYKKYLSDKALFFIPENIEQLIQKYGNRKLYDQQQLNNLDLAEENIHFLIALLHQYKKGLEQEALIIGR